MNRSFSNIFNSKQIDKIEMLILLFHRISSTRNLNNYPNLYFNFLIFTFNSTDKYFTIYQKNYHSPQNKCYPNKRVFILTWHIDFHVKYLFSPNISYSFSLSLEKKKKNLKSSSIDNVKSRERKRERAIISSSRQRWRSDNDRGWW